MPLDNYTMFKLREAQERAKTASLANAMDYAKGLGAGVAGIPGDTANLINALLHVRPTGYGSEDIGRMMGANTDSGAFLAGNLGMPDMGDALRLVGVKGAMTLFHGSPHKFDAFDITKIGTGEGAQKYGHGLYFAENPKVAGKYSEGLAVDKWESVVEGNIKKYIPGIDDTTAGILRRTIQNNEGKTAEEIYEKVGDIYGANYAFLNRNRDATIGTILDAQTIQPKGHLYEVDIPDDKVAKMLDWDKPLSEQPRDVQDAIQKANRHLAGKTPEMPSMDISGEQFYSKLASLNGGRQEASRILNEIGIPGIKYFDGASRTAGGGTRNVVLFDDKSAKILNRK